MRAIVSPHALHSLLRGHSPQYSSAMLLSLSQTVPPLGPAHFACATLDAQIPKTTPFSLRLGNRRPPANAARPAKRRETGCDALILNAGIGALWAAYGRRLRTDPYVRTDKRAVDSGPPARRNRPGPRFTCGLNGERTQGLTAQRSACSRADAAKAPTTGRRQPNGTGLQSDP